MRCPGSPSRKSSGSYPWFALFTYSPDDPGFSQATSGGNVSNGVGRVGALTADMLFNLFGLPAYLFTVMVFYLGWMLYREQKTHQPLTRTDFALRFGGFLLTLVTSCALSTLHFSPAGFNETAGGIVGQMVGHGLAALMKPLGATVLLFFTWVASISLFLGISWFTVMDAIGRTCLKGFEALLARLTVTRLGMNDQVELAAGEAHDLGFDLGRVVTVFVDYQATAADCGAQPFGFQCQSDHTQQPTLEDRLAG